MSLTKSRAIFNLSSSIALFFKSIKKKLEDRLQSGLKSKQTVNKEIKIFFAQKFIASVSKKEKENQLMWEQNLYTILEKHLRINNLFNYLIIII